MDTKPDFVVQWLEQSQRLFAGDDAAQLQARHAVEEAYREAVKQGVAGEDAWRKALQTVGTVSAYGKAVYQKEVRSFRRSIVVLFVVAAVGALYAAVQMAMIFSTPLDVLNARSSSPTIASGAGAGLGGAIGLCLLCLGIGLYRCWQLRQFQQKNQHLG